MLKLPLYYSNREFWGLLDLSLGPALTNFNTKRLLGLDIVALQVPLLSESICPIPLLQKKIVFVFRCFTCGYCIKVMAFFYALLTQGCL